ncbi:redox-regulated ATPase YchF [Synergistaceae bacterium OttesenSCG-928-D05]|nr:redox-regulated ATPase YchF [Synergistaceae bacterium OttesenSCG-928-D05]
MLHCGIVGLPLSGKTTVFNVITRAGAEVKPYAGGKTDPNKAVVSVPDKRFDYLVDVHKPRKETPAQVEFVDLAGLSRGAGKGEGLGNSFLSFVADADALIHVVRCFSNATVEHPEGSVDPVRDWEIIENELIFRDLAVIENRLEKLRAKKKLIPDEESEKKLLEQCFDCLMEEKPLRSLGLKPEDERRLRGFAFVTSKPEILLLNLDDSQNEESKIPGYSELKKRADEQGIDLCTLYGSLEMDIIELTEEEASAFTEGLDITEPGRERLIERAYKVLGLISFFTCGPDEVRAWTLHEGDNAVDAAGAIHSDLARGFIRAQVVAFEDYKNCAHSFDECRKTGVLRLEGKEYLVKDGDIIEIRFNV